MHCDLIAFSSVHKRAFSMSPFECEKKTELARPLRLKLLCNFAFRSKNGKTGLVFAHKAKYYFYTQWTVRQMRGEVIPGNLFEIQAKTTAFCR